MTFTIHFVDTFTVSHGANLHRSHSVPDLRQHNMHARLQLFPLLLSLATIAVIYAYPQEAAARTPIAEDTLDTALNDRRYLMRQIKCALGEAPCDPVGRRLKSLAPFVLRGSCPKCTPDEMRQIQKVLAHVQKNFPKEWNKVVQQYAG